MMLWSIRLKDIGIMITLFVLAGCQVTAPPRVSPKLGFTIPENWTTSEGKAEPVISNWSEWIENDSLQSTMAEALANNHNLKAAADRIQIAIAEAQMVGANLYPQLGASFNTTRHRQNITVPSLSGGKDTVQSTISNTFGMSLDVSWELDLWGRIRSESRAAVADIQAIQADYAGAQLSIAAQAAKAWLAVTEAYQQVTLAEQTVKNYQATAKQATDRADEGIQSPSDKHLALTNLASAKGLLQQRQDAFDGARRQLELLLGRYPAGLIEASSELPALPPPVPAGLPAEIIQRRPDIAVAERRLAASLQRVEAAKASLYPRISLTASGGSSSGEFQDLFSGDNILWTIAGNLVQPIFEGGRLRAQIRANDGRANESASLFAQQVLEAIGEVEGFLATEQFLVKQTEFTQEAARKAQEAVEVSQNRYAQGIESFIVVLESQRRALDTESSLLSLRRQQLETRIDLHLSLGGAFAVTSDQN